MLEFESARALALLRDRHSDVLLPKAQLRLVEAWAEIHRAELQADWDLLQSGQPPIKIEPLR